MNKLTLTDQGKEGDDGLHIGLHVHVLTVTDRQSEETGSEMSVKPDAGLCTCGRPRNTV